MIQKKRPSIARTMKHFFLFLSLVVLLAGCAGPGELVENEGAMLGYQMDRSSGKLDTLAGSYLRTIVANRDNGKLRAGLFADYGATLAMQGHEEEANRWMNMEMRLFPQSKDYVTKLKGMMIPAYADDTLSCIDLDTVGFAAKQQALEQKAAAKEQKASEGKKASKKEEVKETKKEGKKASKKKSKKDDAEELDEEEIGESAEEEPAEVMEEEEEEAEASEEIHEQRSSWSPKVQVVTSGITREYRPKPKPATRLDGKSKNEDENLSEE